MTYYKKYLRYKQKYLKLKAILGGDGPTSDKVLSPSKQQIINETSGKPLKPTRGPTDEELKEEAVVAAAFVTASNRRNKVHTVKKLDSIQRVVYKPLFPANALYSKNDIYEKNTTFTKIFELNIPYNAFNSLTDYLSVMYDKICIELGFRLVDKQSANKGIIDYIYVNDYKHYILIRISVQYITLFFDIDYMHNLDYNEFNNSFNKFHKIAYILSLLYKNKPTLEDINEKRTIDWFPKYIDELSTTEDIDSIISRFKVYLPLYYLNIVSFSEFPNRNLYLDYVYSIFLDRSTILELDKLMNSKEIILPEYPLFLLPDSIEKSTNFDFFNNKIYKLTGREFQTRFEFKFIMDSFEELLHKTKDERIEFYNIYLSKKKTLLIVGLAFIANHYKAYTIVFEIIHSIYLNQIDDVNKILSGYRNLIKYTIEEWNKEEEMYKIEMLKGGKKYKLSNLVKLK
jgi:hypothetical protein